MTRSASKLISVAIALATIAVGCSVQTAPPWVVAGAQPIAVADEQAAEQLFSPVDAWSGKVTVAAAQRPPVPHAGLQLPRVSPDGQWIACLATIADTAPGIGPDSLINGDGLQGVQLVVRAIADEIPASIIASPGPCWPTWINDHELLFISYDERGTCALAVYDVITQTVQRKSLGLRHMFAPAPNRDGRRVAVAGWGNLADESVIFIADLVNLQLAPGPPPTIGAGAQMLPRWIGDDTLLYIELGKEEGHLMRWTIGDRESHVVAAITTPPSVFDAHHILGGIVEPVSPGLTYYAAYLPVYDAVVLTNLADESRIVTRRGTKAGAWWTQPWFIGSDDSGVNLIHVDAQATPPKTLPLLRGQWAPLWTDPAAKSLILAGPAEDPRQLNVTQLWLVLEDEPSNP